MIISLYSPTQQSGKSTVAAYITQKYGFDVIKFAAPLYDMIFALAKGMFRESEAYRLVCVDKNAIWPVLNVSTRTLMRTLGTNWARDMICETIWVDIARERIKQHVDWNLVFDDNRFRNECDMLREFDTIFVRVVRPDAYVDRSHQSEGLLDDFDFDYTIVNDGSIGDLYRKVDDMMEAIGYE